MRANTVQDILDRITRVPEAGCWLWEGATSGGYGVVVWEQTQVKLHRFMWELIVGPIPAEQWVLHKCDVRSCCNPSHLFLGDARANVHDAVSKRRHAKMGHTHCPHGHAYTPENTRYRTWSTGRRSKFCAECYRREQTRCRRARALRLVEKSA